jgi:PilZ domain
MAKNKRVARRVGLDHAIDAVAIAADGTWSVKGQVEDISATGAKFHVFNPINARMRSEEFFLAMTPDGKVKRRSKLVWEKSGVIGIGFTAAKG